MTISEAIAWGIAKGKVKISTAKKLSVHRWKEINKEREKRDARCGSRKKPSQAGEVRRYIVYPK
jgi:hypothetical protein